MPKPFSDQIKQQWKEKILQQRVSGLSIPSWCIQNGVAVYNFRYWQSKLFPNILNRSSFCEIPSTSDKTGIYLEYQEIKIHLSQQFDPQTLQDCLEVLKKC